MKIWIAKDSEVSVREQLSTQIALGIASGEYQVGEKLPSTREIARRCGVHANTVGAVYRLLVDQRLLEFRQGSGFYVAETAAESIEGSNRLDTLVHEFLSAAAALGFTRKDLIERLQSESRGRPSGRLTLIESDEGLRDILVHELAAESFPVSALSFEEFAVTRSRKPMLLAAMFDEKPKIDALLENGQKCIYLHGRSVSAAMAEESRPSPHDLIAIVSGWSGFLTFARVMLLAARVPPGNLIVRSTSEAEWEDAIRPASIVICDSLTARRLPSRDGIRSFQIISEQSISELHANLNGTTAS